MAWCAIALLRRRCPSKPQSAGVREGSACRSCDCEACGCQGVGRRLVQLGHPTVDAPNRHRDGELCPQWAFAHLDSHSHFAHLDSHSHFAETIAAPRTRRYFVPSSHAVELWGWRQGAMAGFNSTYLNVTLDEVKANFAFFGLLDGQVRLHGSIPRRPILPAAFRAAARHLHTT